VLKVSFWCQAVSQRTQANPNCRCLAHHPSPLHGRLLRTIPRYIHYLGDKGYGARMELLAEDLLHALLAVHHLSYDKRVCADKRTRKGVEVWHALPSGQHCHHALLVPVVQEMGPWL